MRNFVLTTALTTSCYLAAPAYADVTPEEVWETYHQMMEGTGLPVTAEVNREGDTLVVRDMVYGMEMQVGEIKTTSTSTVPEIRFQERPGGEVAIWQVGPITTVTVMPVDPVLGDEHIETRVEMMWEGEALVSGTPENLLFTVRDGDMTMTSEPVYQDGHIVQPAFDMVLNDISGTQTLVRRDDAHDVDMDITGASLTYGVKMSDATSGDIDMTAVLRGLSLSGMMTMPVDGGENDLAKVFSSYGADIEFGAESTTLSMDTNSVETGAATTISGTTEESTLNLTLDKGQLGYDVAAQDITLSIGGAMIPGGQVDFQLARMAETILLPLAASDEDQAFKLGIELEGLVLPDIAWMMADPSGQLPHDPADLRIAFEGTVQSDFNIFNVEMLEADEMPFDFKTLSLSEIYVALAGATIAGEGAGHFLEKESAIPGGMLPFAGQLSLTLNGVSDLITKLSSTGILPAEEAMSAQMMLGLFAVPGEKPGELVSEIEMTEEGVITANGQPLPF